MLQMTRLPAGGRRVWPWHLVPIRMTSGPRQRLASRTGRRPALASCARRSRHTPPPASRPARHGGYHRLVATPACLQVFLPRAQPLTFYSTAPRRPAPCAVTFDGTTQASTAQQAFAGDEPSSTFLSRPCTAQCSLVQSSMLEAGTSRLQALPNQDLANAKQVQVLYRNTPSSRCGDASKTARRRQAWPPLSLLALGCRAMLHGNT